MNEIQLNVIKYLAEQVLGNKEKAERYLNTKSIALGNKKPIELDYLTVHDELWRIEYGIFV